MKRPDLGKAALALANRGLAVFPCKPRGKEPDNDHGFLEATTDPATINSWWEARPDRNIGVACGKASHIVVLDIDGEDGEVSLAALEGRHGKLPATVEAITGNGRHVYLKTSAAVPNSVGKLGPGLDVRGDRGYVIAPPSVHPSGRIYAWSVDCADRIADSPAWLTELITTKRNGRANGATPDWAKPIPEGQRNATLTRIAGTLFAKGLSAAEVGAAVAGLNASQCRPPLPTAEVEKLLHSIGAREAAKGKNGQGQALTLPEPTPWIEPVDGLELLDGLAAAIQRHVVLETHEAAAVALWAVHTHVFNAGMVTPRLGITSPEKRCGKTTLLDVLGCLVPRPLPAANITAAATFRTIEVAQPTLLIDEADTFLGDNEDLRGVLNSGHKRGGSVVRLVGDKHEPRRFATYTPVAIAMIGALPGTLADRSIPVRLRRRRSDEAVIPFREDRTEGLAKLASMAARWAADNSEDLRHADPDMAGLFNRDADNWRPLLAIADAAGGHWPARARAAAKVLTAAGEEDQTSIGQMALSDIRAAFESSGADRLTSAELVGRLVVMEGRPWPEFGHARKPITANGLARLLRPFKVKPVNMRAGGELPAKGYFRSAFEDAFERYLAPVGSDSTATPEQDQQYQRDMPNSQPLQGGRCSGCKCA